MQRNFNLDDAIITEYSDQHSASWQIRSKGDS
jgi:hypothetical protein